MKYKAIIEFATFESKELFRSYMAARNASNSQEAEAIRDEIERMGYRVTVDAMDGYKPALGTKSGAIVYSI